MMMPRHTHLYLYILKLMGNMDFKRIKDDFSASTIYKSTKILIFEEIILTIRASY